MSRKFFNTRSLLILLGATALGLWLVQRWIAPYIVTRRVNYLIQKKCESCRLELDSLGVRFAPPSLLFSGIRFSGGKKSETFVSAQAAYVQAELSPWALLRRDLRVGPIRVDTPEVTVTEGDNEAPDEKNDAPPMDDGGSAQVEKISVQNGSFTYRRNHLKQRASFQLHEIDAEIGPFGSTLELRDQAAEGTARGLLERSGRFVLEVKAKLFAPAAHVDTYLKITGQNLADINAYFVPGDGLTLAGTLREGHGKSTVRGNHAQSWVYAKYEGLEFDVKKTSERSALSAFFTNLVSGLILKSKNTNRPWIDRTESAAIEREPKESLVSFILRSLQEAALKVPRK